MQTLNKQDVDSFRQRGFHIVRGVFNTDEIDRLRTGFAHIQQLAARTDLAEEVLKGQGDVHIHLHHPEAISGPTAVQYLRKVQWPSLLHPAFEEIRTSAKFPALLEPLIGSSLKQYINQINFKMPGGQIAFPWHQDTRPTPAFTDQGQNYVQTIIAVDEATIDNGCLHLVPGSHKLGDLKANRSGQAAEHVDVSTAVACEAAPGDVILFTSFTVHGSVPNSTAHPRRSYINGFVRADTCTIGKWAFLEGKPVPVTSDRDYHALRAT